MKGFPRIGRTVKGAVDAAPDGVSRAVLTFNLPAKLLSCIHPQLVLRCLALTIHYKSI